jgi:uncharacterized membrane protein YhaH (DUF805 family)
MATANPYQAPRATVADTSEQYQPVKLFSASGRIGRARYIAYTVGLWFVVQFAIGIAAAAFAVKGIGIVTGLLLTIAWGVLIVISFMLTIQRCHDFNGSGWLALLVLIPLVNLMFWFVPGTDGENRYGAPPPPNNTLVIVGALVVPIVAVVGILAAVAIPAYQSYAKRAQATQQQGR